MNAPDLLKSSIADASVAPIARAAPASTTARGTITFLGLVPRAIPAIRDICGAGLLERVSFEVDVTLLANGAASVRAVLRGDAGERVVYDEHDLDVERLRDGDDQHLDIMDGNTRVLAMSWRPVSGQPQVEPLYVATPLTGQSELPAGSFEPPSITWHGPSETHRI